jgi:hypothetical protein
MAGVPECVQSLDVAIQAQEFSTLRFQMYVYTLLTFEAPYHSIQAVLQLASEVGTICRSGGPHCVR